MRGELSEGTGGAMGGAFICMLSTEPRLESKRSDTELVTNVGERRGC